MMYAAHATHRLVLMIWIHGLRADRQVINPWVKEEGHRSLPKKSGAVHRQHCDDHTMIRRPVDSAACGALPLPPGQLPLNSG